MKKTFLWEILRWGLLLSLLILPPLKVGCQDEEEEEDAAGTPLQAAPVIVPVTPGTLQTDMPVGIKYENQDLEEVLKDYSQWTGRALMKSPDVPAGAKITLKCPKRLPKREALLAIESVLAMHGIALVPMGEYFLKVVKIDAARQSGMLTDTNAAPFEKHVAETDHLVSRIVELKHLEMTEAQAAIQNFLHPYAKIIPLERVNCMLITETAINIKRIMEILEIIDQPIESREELKIFQIKYAKASEIQAKIESVIADAQAKDTSKTRIIRQQLVQQRLPFQPATPPAQPGPSGHATTTGEGLDRSLIQSRVKIVADDRINSLIVITRREQFPFIESMIKALDQKVEPDVNIKVVILEYAEAKTVVGVLNNLISASSSGAKTGQPQPPFLPPGEPPKPGEPARDKKQTTGPEMQISGKLSSDVKIIADERINALLIMACKADMEIIEDVLAKVDIMLAQVLIEVVIIEVDLSDQFKMGIDWLQRSMIAYNAKKGGGRRAFMGFSGAGRVGADGAIKDATTITKVSDNTTSGGSGLTYYFTFFDYNLDAVLNMLASSSDAKILATPVVLTTDNKEAKILVGEKRPVITGTSISSATQQSTYQYVDIGINLEVKPHINKKGFVIMDIKQKVDNKGEDVTIDGNPVPVIITRDFNASISVNDGRTIVIGGIVSEDRRKRRTKIPFLGDIPLVGLLFRSDDIETKRVELMVMLTPYVLDTPEEAYGETARRKNSLSNISNLWIKGWAPPDMASPSPAEIKSTKREEVKRGEIESDAVKPVESQNNSRSTESPRAEQNYQMRISNSPAAGKE